jgi:DNA adenine methylase
MELFKPAYKWVGGKRKIIKDIHKIIKEKFNFNPNKNKYFEPFFGGGAMFFSFLQFSELKNAVISDYNSEIAITMQLIRDNPTELVEQFYNYVNEMTQGDAAEYYYSVRNWDRDGKLANKSNLEKAARFLFLNRFGFNGMYRVNSNGKFNVPFGRNTYRIHNETESISPINKEYFNFISKKLTDSKTEVLCCDYKSIEAKVKRGDLIYLDPPYMPVSKTSAFTGYTDKGFTFEDQKELANFCFRLAEKGANVIISNSFNEEIRKLYSDLGFKFEIIKAMRAINSKGEGREKVNEYLIYKAGSPIVNERKYEYEYANKSLPQANSFKLTLVNLVQNFINSDDDFFSPNDIDWIQYKIKSKREIDYYIDALYFLDWIEFAKKNECEGFILTEQLKSHFKYDEKTKAFKLVWSKVLKQLKTYLNYFYDINLSTNKEVADYIFKFSMKVYSLAESTAKRRANSIEAWIRDLGGEDFYE